MFALRLLALIFICSALGCTSGEGGLSQKLEQTQSKDTIRIKDTLWLRDTIYLKADPDWQKYFEISHDPHTDSIWGQTVDYYISDPECDALAFDFYYGTFRPADNASTAELLQLVISPNDKLRPFYRWCLQKTMEIADGALGEYPGEPARLYAERYPKEFMDYMYAQPDSSSYYTWVSLIAFSGLHEFNYDANQSFEEVRKRMRQACADCTEEEIAWIDRFATDISSYEP